MTGDGKQAQREKEGHMAPAEAFVRKAGGKKKKKKNSRARTWG